MVRANVVPSGPALAADESCGMRLGSIPACNAAGGGGVGGGGVGGEGGGDAMAVMAAVTPPWSVAGACGGGGGASIEDLGTRTLVTRELGSEESKSEPRLTPPAWPSLPVSFVPLRRLVRVRVRVRVRARVRVRVRVRVGVRVRVRVRGRVGVR